MVFSLLKDPDTGLPGFPSILRVPPLESYNQDIPPNTPTTTLRLASIYISPYSSCNCLFPNSVLSELHSVCHEERIKVGSLCQCITRPGFGSATRDTSVGRGGPSDAVWQRRPPCINCVSGKIRATIPFNKVFPVMDTPEFRFILERRECFRVQIGFHVE